jgi:hypothetical protein
MCFLGWFTLMCDDGEFESLSKPKMREQKTIVGRWYPIMQLFYKDSST